VHIVKNSYRDIQLSEIAEIERILKSHLLDRLNNGLLSRAPRLCSIWRGVFSCGLYVSKRKLYKRQPKGNDHDI
jgi:hypothetical protein